jgi:cytosine/adenosine deaminase-related metal-dependent hydrolase
MSLWRQARPLAFVNARVVAPVGAPDGATEQTLRVAAGRVAALGGGPEPGDQVIDLDGAFIYPGLINAHDHLELNNFPRLKWRERHANAREWVADFQPRFNTDPALAAAMAPPQEDRLLIGGLKNLLAGVTTVAHHNPLHAPLRRASYPVRVVREYGWSHSLHIDGDEAVASAYRLTPRDWPWIVHAAEGTDAEAAGELGRLDGLGCLGPNTVLVHGVGLTAAGRARLLEARGGLVWCPASNEFTLGATAVVGELARAGRVALGSDSRLSGSPDLLHELQCAAATGQTSPAELFRMVTADAAALLRLPHAGRLAPGGPADLMVVRPLAADPYETLILAARRDVGLVMVDGRPAVAEDALAAVFEATRVDTRPVKVDGRSSLLAARLAGQLRRAACSEPGLELLSREAV